MRRLMNSLGCGADDPGAMLTKEVIASLASSSDIAGLDGDSKAKAEQVRTVERVGDRLGVVPHAIMLDVDEALRLHFGL
jgi:mRNA-degrading endonuclease toxin of MazEF toxin-antitoxin module